jgi:hypothetical protein
MTAMKPEMTPVTESLHARLHTGDWIEVSQIFRISYVTVRKLIQIVF